MNSKLENLLSQLRGASERFNEVMQKKEDEFIRDSAIQRFEFTFELGWKTMKAYLEEKGVKVYSPKDAIRGAFQERILSKDDGEIWLKMLETRNKTTHIYNEAMAENVYRELPPYVPVIKRIVEELS